MTGIPEGAQLSEDGSWWWDGQEWQPVPASAGSESGGAGDEGDVGQSAEVTAEELQSVGDNEASPAPRDLLTARLMPYFQPNGDDVPDDDSGAELDAALDEDEFTGEVG
jgi:hypothetical protein